MAKTTTLMADAIKMKTPVTPAADRARPNARREQLVLMNVVRIGDDVSGQGETEAHQHDHRHVRDLAEDEAADTMFARGVRIVTALRSI
jgi:hypothetical protein